MSSSDLTIYTILINAVKTVTSIGDLTFPLFVENEEKPDPTYTGIWIEETMLPFPNTSMGKAATDADENGGILQLSLFDTDTGGGVGALLALVDDIKDVFKHGVEFIASGVTVFIDEASRNNSRQSGGKTQIDISIIWSSYITR